MQHALRICLGLWRRGGDGRRRRIHRRWRRRPAAGAAATGSPAPRHARVVERRAALPRRARTTRPISWPSIASITATAGRPAPAAPCSPPSTAASTGGARTGVTVTLRAVAFADPAPASPCGDAGTMLRCDRRRRALRQRRRPASTRSHAPRGRRRLRSLAAWSPATAASALARRRQQLRQARACRRIAGAACASPSTRATASSSATAA